ncbi:MAG: hypothetical protein PHP92_05690 [Candidatus Nanoarchaeia archaeon]|nr:hypothetical protein [Candidatus Nanoarchaeia archaeon]
MDLNNYDDVIRMLKNQHHTVVWLSELNKPSFRKGVAPINPKSKLYKRLVETLKIHTKEDVQKVRDDIAKE